MAYIKADHKKMLATATQIDKYITQLDKNMASIESAMVSVESEWKGEDYRQLKAEWNEINSSGSTSDKMRTSLKNYADSIRKAAELYNEAQIRAINRANVLCK